MSSMTSVSSMAPRRAPRGAPRALLVFVALLALVVGPGIVAPPRAEAAPAFRVLVFSKVTNYPHDSIPAGVEAIEKLGAEHGLDRKSVV